LQFVRCELIKQDYWCLHAAEVILLYTLRYRIIIVDIFYWSLSFPRALSTLTFCASFAASIPTESAVM